MAIVRDAARPLAVKDSAGNASFQQAITPSDTVDLPMNTSRIYVGVSGHITYLDRSGTSRVMKNAVQGSVVHGDFKRVMATGTTATDLLAVY